jgi:hypothetical protein
MLLKYLTFTDAFLSSEHFEAVPCWWAGWGKYSGSSPCLVVDLIHISIRPDVCELEAKTKHGCTDEKSLPLIWVIWSAIRNHAAPDCWGGFSIFLREVGTMFHSSLFGKLPHNSERIPCFLLFEELKRPFVGKFPFNSWVYRVFFNFAEGRSELRRIKRTGWGGGTQK